MRLMRRHWSHMMFNASPFKRFLAALLLLAGALGAARAEDIDIFGGSQPAEATSPYLLFIMDTGASMEASAPSGVGCNIDDSGNVLVNNTGSAANNTAFHGKMGGVEQCALYAALKALYDAGVNVHIGIMFFNNGQKTLNPNTGTVSSLTLEDNCVANDGGGCVGLRFTSLTSTTAPRILQWIRKWDKTGTYNIKAPASRGDGAVMQESWAYFFGKTGLSGTAYTAPDATCASKYLVFLGNAYDTQASPKDSTNNASSPKNAFTGASTTPALARATPTPSSEELATTDMIETYSSLKCGTSTKSGTVTTDENKGSYALYWARYMRNQGVTTYSIGITGTDCDSTYVANLTHLARDVIGGGKFFNTTNYDELVEAIKTIVSEVQSVNSVFASAALPASVNTQGLYLNQVFIGMFRPATQFLPRWTGNLKHYKMGLVNNALQLQDADDGDAINTLTGFITECARSYWSADLPVDTYWSAAASAQKGTCTITGAKASDTPDGNVVEKGAQARKLRALSAPSDRVVKTCGSTMASCSSMSDFTTTTLSGLSTATFAATSASDKEAIINWIRGQNIGSTGEPDGELAKPTTGMRPSVHGDVVHSRPVAVNHGTDDDPKIVVYYGGNDGMLRSVAASRTTDMSLTTISGTATGTVTYTAGQEVWSFMPPEFYGKIARLRNNTESVSHPNSSTGTGSPKDYGMDGPITSYTGTFGGATKTYLYATMRRGGRAVYAFDVTYPGSPSLLWKKGCTTTDNTDCSSGFTSIGQTWGSLRSILTTGYNDGGSPAVSKPLMIMGGGYDACEDYDHGYATDTSTSTGKNHQCVAGPGEGGGTEGSTVTKGNRIYILDAATGAVIREFKTRRAVIADVSIIRDGTGKAILGYTGDLGGYVYRLSLSGNDTSTWSITTIASLGCNDPTACTDSVANRKFMFAPSVLALGNNKYQVLIGSGDREKPVTKYYSSANVTNYFFSIVDDVGATTSAPYYAALNPTCGGDWICVAALHPITGSGTPTTDELTLKPQGWYLGLSATEQVVTNPITIFGVVTFSTHLPSTGSASQCKVDLGETRVYNVYYKNAQGVTNGQLSNTRWADVSGDGLPPSPIGGKVKLDDGTIVPFCMGCDGGSPLKPKQPPGVGTKTSPKSRLYWYIER